LEVVNNYNKKKIIDRLSESIHLQSGSNRLTHELNESGSIPPTFGKTKL